MNKKYKFINWREKYGGMVHEVPPDKAIALLKNIIEEAYRPNGNLESYDIAIPTSRLEEAMDLVRDVGKEN